MILRWRLLTLQPGGCATCDCSSYEEAENRLTMMVQRGAQIVGFQITPLDYVIMHDSPDEEVAAEERS